MDRLDLIMQILNKVENEGYEPTEEEAKMIVEFIDDVMSTIKVVMKQFREMLTQMAEVINSWWNALPEETRVSLRELSGIPQPLPKMATNQVSALGAVGISGQPGIAGQVSIMINNPFGDAINSGAGAYDIAQATESRRRMMEN